MSTYYASLPSDVALTEAIAAVLQLYFVMNLHYLTESHSQFISSYSALPAGLVLPMELEITRIKLEDASKIFNRLLQSTILILRRVKL